MKTLLRSKLVIAAAVLTTLGAITFACSDFLDQPAQGTVDEVTLATKTGVEGSLIAAYRSLDCSSSSAGSWGCAASNWVWGSVPSGDAYKGSNLGDQQPINSIETYFWNISESDDYINQKWAQVFEGVSRSNATIRLLDKIIAEKPNELTREEQLGIRGEATFLRAHYHFEAYRMWGSNSEGGVGGIPYYREADLDFRKTNVGTDALAEIIADLNLAITVLDSLGSAPRNGDKGRATVWTARAYKGKVLAYAAAITPARWNDVKAVLDSVVSSNVYSLETTFNKVHTGIPAQRNGPETIFAFQATVRDGEPSGWNSNWGERLNFPHSGSHFGCCGFHQASFNLINFFRVDAAGLPLAYTDPTWNSPPLQPQGSLPPSDTATVNPLPWKGQNFWAGNLRPVDPRVDWTVGRDAVPYKDWGLHNRSWIRDASYSGPYSGKKPIHESSSQATSENNVGWQATQTNNVNVHILRYADVLLLLAEAEVELNNLTRSAQLVNMLRARAAAGAQGCGTSSLPDVVAAYPTCASNPAIQPMTIPLAAVSATLDTLYVPWAQYRIGEYPVPFPTQAQARLAVRMERRLELAMEGQRFFDLRRWGVADTAITNYLATEEPRIPYLSLAQAFGSQYSRYPIPTVQIELSRVGTEDRLQQNPGW
ncbi:MAG TPA: RagB/SusD family nutrient uptake outer membrane protein [Gemmatimonadales bacterium]|nr:RagB/SusD family nutrient uptake outer membrane protein [Gemmatimonadales bacterium]